MTIGASLCLLAVGAILKWAITAHVEGVNLQTMGVILLVVGGAGLALGLFHSHTCSPAWTGDSTTTAPMPVGLSRAWHSAWALKSVTGFELNAPPAPRTAPRAPARRARAAA